mgnify:CR=1 FL=1
MFGCQYEDSDIDELVDCLIACPNIVACVYLGQNRLTDRTGIKLAWYVAASSTLQELSLYRNQFGEATYLAIAAALRVNTSLQYLDLNYNKEVDQTRIYAAFVEALRLNPRPAGSVMYLHKIRFNDEYSRLEARAIELGHPTLQMLLVDRC